jgi:REP element-mobilizing transposase RayT
MVQQWWLELENKFSRVRADAYIVMPNHIHGILEMRSLSREGRRGDSGIEANRVPLSRVVQWFKTMTTNAYLRGVKENGWPTCPGKLWQRNYFEHVIERGNALNAIRRYIQENPLRWAFDHENPARSRAEEDGWEQVLNENQS